MDTLHATTLRFTLAHEYSVKVTVALIGVDARASGARQSARTFSRDSRGADHGSRKPSQFRLRAVRGRGEGHEPVSAVGADRRPSARLELRAGALELRRGAAAAHPRLRPDQQEGSRAPRALPGKSEPARHDLHLQLAVCRLADHHARRDRAVAPAYAERAALHRRRRGRLHRGRRREAADEARRLRGDAGLGLARPRQSRRRAGGLARRARYAVRALLRRGVPRRASPRTSSRSTGRRASRLRCTA